MLKKINMKKLAQMVEGSQWAISTMKGITIGDKCPLGEMPNITPTKKGKMASDTKKKGLISLPKDKKRETLT